MTPQALPTKIWVCIREYRPLAFWLVWGSAMGLFSSFVFHEFLHLPTVFFGIGMGLGLTFQFVKGNWPRRVACLVCLLVAGLVVSKHWISFVQRTLGHRISRSYLVDDVRQLAFILDATHPDPYLRGGGKVAFHRRMQDVIRGIPEKGMTQIQFYQHLSPLLASVGDGHTAFWPPYHLNGQSPGGIPLSFQPVENLLYVAGIIDPAHEHLIGSKLLSVEGISLEALLKRQAQIKGYDNEYQLMRYLAYDGSLWYGQPLAHLVPEWSGGAIRVALEDPGGARAELSLPPNTKGVGNLLFAATRIEMPSTERSNYAYRFMDGDKKTVLLTMENMYTYRESFEMERVIQKSLREDLAEHLYRQYTGESPPVDDDALVAGLLSATGLFRELLKTMKTHRSENLIIDLRRNEGGNAFISTILFYFLHGKEALISFSDRKSIFVRKLSPLFWRQYPDWDINAINEHQPIQLTETDYDFSVYPDEGHVLSREESIRIIEEEASAAATFWEEYQSEKYSGYYRPKNVLILCSPLTCSSAYSFMYDHWAAGAKVVGVPSSQAGNTCGAWVGFRLPYSRLHGGVSHLHITHFRDNPEMGRTFRPDYEMTYADLKSLGFDPNAEVLHAMTLISR